MEGAGGVSSPPPVRYWRLVFSEGGALESIREIDGPRDASWVIIEAPDQKTAERRAFSIYCARKKKLAKERNHRAGNCACGRKQDRKHPSGEPMLVCSVCAERQKVYNDRLAARAASGAKAGAPVRDEAARVAANLSRQRDRRGEIRLETLIEVRQQWIASRNVALFGKWLTAEIDRLTGADSGAAA